MTAVFSFPRRELLSPTDAAQKIRDLTHAAELLARPPNGMLSIDGVLRIRRAGFCKHEQLICRNGHHMRSRPGQRPIEEVMRCGFRETRFAVACEARLFVFRTRARNYFAMDVTKEEDDAIEFREMDLDDVIAWFGIELVSARPPNALIFPKN